MTRVVACTDLHGDAVTAGFERFDDAAAALWQAGKHAVEVKADAFAFLGDLCDPDSKELIRCVCLAQAVAIWLGEREVDSYWLAGNHDVIEDGHGTTVLDPVNAAPRAVVVARPSVGEVGGSVVLWLPYTALAANYNPRECVADLDVAPSAVFGHLMLEGIGPGSETTDFPRGRDLFWPNREIAERFPGALMVGGHYHEPGEHGGVRLPGSMLRLTRADAGRRAVFLDLEFR